MKHKSELSAALAALFTPEADARNAGDAERVINHLLNLSTDEETKNIAAETGQQRRAGNSQEPC